MLSQGIYRKASIKTWDIIIFPDFNGRKKVAGMMLSDQQSKYVSVKKSIIHVFLTNQDFLAFVCKQSGLFHGYQG